MTAYLRRTLTSPRARSRSYLSHLSDKSISFVTLHPAKTVATSMTFIAAILNAHVSALALVKWSKLLRIRLRVDSSGQAESRSIATIRLVGGLI